MKNRYDGKCARCGMTVPANTGELKNENNKWIVYHTECPEITSGLGIGGAGSDDHNISSTGDTGTWSTGKLRRNGGGQLWEPCPRCGQEPVHLDCGYCDKHCKC